MAHSTQQTEDNKAFEFQIRECFGRVAYSHKTHEKMAEHCASRLWLGKWAQIILSALTAGGALGVIFTTDSPWLPYATAASSILTLILNSYLKDLDPGAMAQRHREAAASLWGIREEYLSLLTDTLDKNILLNDLRIQREKLHEKLLAVYTNAPHTNSKGYSAAQDSLQNREDLTFTDQEIDAFLPGPLKRSK